MSRPISNSEPATSSGTLRPEPSRLPAVLGPEALEREQPAVLDPQADRPGKLDDLDPLLADGVDLLRVGRHLVDGSPVDERDRLGADAACGPDAVHGGVAGTDDGHPRPDRHGPALADAAQEGHAIDHVRRILAGETERLRALGSDRDENGREPVAPKVVEHDVDAGALAVADLDAEALQDGEILVDLRLGEPVGRDRPADHAAGIGMRLEDRDRDAVPGQPLGGRQAGRSGPDDRHPAVRREIDRGGCCEATLLLLHDEALDLADRERLVEVRANARVLAQVIADAAQHRRQRVVQARDADGLPVIAGSHRGHVLRGPAGRRDTRRDRARRCSRTGRAGAAS